MATSSEYYRKVRESLEDPNNHCQFCGKPIVRKFNPNNKRWEDYKSFTNRRYCDKSCARKKQALDRREEIDKRFFSLYKATFIPELSCSKNGEFIYKGKKKKVISTRNRRGEAQTARITFFDCGKQQYYSAAKLIAQTWLNASEDDYIEYRDGDIHNIAVDNLHIISKEQYYSKRMKIASEGRMSNTFDYQIKRIRNVVEEAQAVLYYFETGSMEKINKHVTDYLYNALMDYCIQKEHMGMFDAQSTTAEVIARMYEVILTNHAITHLEHWCKELLHNYRKKGWFGFKGQVPKEIKLYIHNELNLECLCNKYKVTNLR